MPSSGMLLPDTCCFGLRGQACWVLQRWQPTPIDALSHSVQNQASVSKALEFDWLRPFCAAHQSRSLRGAMLNHLTQNAAALLTTVGGAVAYVGLCGAVGRFHLLSTRLARKLMHIGAPAQCGRPISTPSPSLAPAAAAICDPVPPLALPQALGRSSCCAGLCTTIR